MQISSRGFNKDNLSLAVDVLTFALTIFGVFVVYSASYYQSQSLYGDEFLYLKKQIFGVFLGWISFFIIKLLGTDFLKKFYIVLPIIAAVLLCLVFIPGISVEAYGARRWINLGFFTIQPSEIAKFALVVFSAAYFEKNYRKTKGIVGSLPFFLMGGLFCGLIILQPNLSVCVDIALSVFLISIVAGLDAKWMIGFCLLGLIALPILIAIEPYRMARLIAFLDPWSTPKTEGYQLIQSLYAIGNGGLFGTGYLNSRQALKFLPFAESDFIFSIICEEFGLFGAITVLCAFLAIVIIGIKKSMNAKDRYNSMLCFAATVFIAVQVIINVAVVSGSIPPTGLPLPLISAGNTQIIVFCMMSAVISATKCDHLTLKCKTP